MPETVAISRCQVSSTPQLIQVRSQQYMLLPSGSDVLGSTIAFTAGTVAPWRTYLPEPLLVEREFHRLAEEWLSDTMAASSAARMFLHPAYQRIIGMGMRAVPLILEELRTRGGHWFWALQAITGDDPVPAEHVGNVALMKQDWLRWGQRRILLSM